MAWYYGTYRCGHDGCANIIGPGKERAWKKERAFSNLCPECYKKELEKERERVNEEAAEKSIEMELPELKGTEKQVAWAITLRLKVIERYENCVQDDKRFYIYNKEGKKVWTSREELSDALDYAIKKYVDAKYWIDSRFNTEILADFIEEYKKYEMENDIPDDVKQEIIDLNEQLTVVPEASNLKNGVVEIECTDNVLYVRYIKDDDFIRIIKELNYKWNGVWHKTITEYTGSADERAAELGNKLLISGFTVQFPNIESKRKALSAEFYTESDRWVKYNTKLGQLSLVWTKRSDVLYENAKKLPGAKWKDGSIKVKIEFYREVEDFAETMGFSISNMARKKIEEFKQKECRFETARVSVKKEENVSDEDRIEKSLKAAGTIIRDLVDE